MSKTVQIHFSPTQTTAGIINRIAEAFPESEQISLMRDIDPVVCEKTDTAIVGMPVFAGRIPAIAKQRLMKIKGKQTPAVVVVVYGNRAYEDALLELKNTLEQNGFVVAAAGAFIARHSLFPAAAAGRPDQNDLKIIDDFAIRCAEKIKSGIFPPLAVPGNFPYKEVSPIPLFPAANESCILCAKCAEVCPAGAIKREDLRKTDTAACISCAACVHVCPAGARRFQGEMYERAGQMILPKCAAYLKPEIFV